MSTESPLAIRKASPSTDPRDYIEIAHADPHVPSMPLSKMVKEEPPDNIDRRIFIFEHASQFDLLSLYGDVRVEKDLAAGFRHLHAACRRKYR